MVHPHPCTDICILLVAPEITSLKKTLMLLLDANYRVAVAYNAEDALAQIQEKKRKVNLVLTETKLPDMCPFRFVDILDSVFKLPVVVLCENYDTTTMLSCLSNGAMYCFAKPLRLRNVENLWQHSLFKEGVNLRESSGLGDTNEDSETLEEQEEVEEEQEEENIEGELQPFEFPVATNSPSMGMQPPVAPGWTMNTHSKFTDVMWDSEVPDVTPELFRHSYFPRLSTDLMTEKLQDPPRASGFLPPGNTTFTEVPPLTLAPPLARPLVEDAKENGDPVHRVPAFSPYWDPTASSSGQQGNGEGTSSCPDESCDKMCMDG